MFVLTAVDDDDDDDELAVAQQYGIVHNYTSASPYLFDILILH